MNVSEYTTKKLILTSWVGSSQGKSSPNASTSNFSDVEISTPHSRSDFGVRLRRETSARSGRRRSVERAVVEPVETQSNADAHGGSPLPSPHSPHQPKKGWDLLKPLKQWLDSVQIHNEKQADLICQLIPAQCPFEREIKLFGRTILRIPPLCKLNPIYDELVGLRFRALCYLVDECGK